MTKTKLTKEMLFGLLVSPDTRSITVNGITGVFSSVQREDGSGRSFNVTLNTKTGPKTTHVRVAA